MRKVRQLLEAKAPEVFAIGPDAPPSVIAELSATTGGHITRDLAFTATFKGVELPPKLKDALWDIRLGHDFVLMRVEKKAFYGKTVHCTHMWVIDPDD